MNSHDQVTPPPAHAVAFSDTDNASRFGRAGEPSRESNGDEDESTMVDPRHPSQSNVDSVAPGRPETDGSAERSVEDRDKEAANTAAVDDVDTATDERLAADDSADRDEVAPAVYHDSDVDSGQRITEALRPDGDDDQVPRVPAQRSTVGNADESVDESDQLDPGHAVDDGAQIATVADRSDSAAATNGGAPVESAVYRGSTSTGANSPATDAVGTQTDAPANERDQVALEPDNSDADGLRVDNSDADGLRVDNSDVDSFRVDNPDADRADVDRADVDRSDVVGSGVDNSGVDRSRPDESNVDSLRGEKPDVDGTDVDSASVSAAGERDPAGPVLVSRSPAQPLADPPIVDSAHPAPSDTTPAAAEPTSGVATVPDPGVPAYDAVSSPALGDSPLPPAQTDVEGTAVNPDPADRRAPDTDDAQAVNVAAEANAANEMDAAVEANATNEMDAAVEANAANEADGAVEANAANSGDAATDADAVHEADAANAADEGDAVTAADERDAAIAADERYEADSGDEAEVASAADERDAADEATAADAVNESGGAVAASPGMPGEAELVAGLWPAADVEGLRQRWQDLQLRFVDDPRAATEEADFLVGEAVDTLTASLSNLRADLGRWRAEGSGDTEELRIAVQRYRQFLDHVLVL